MKTLGACLPSATTQNESGGLGSRTRSAQGDCPHCAEGHLRLPDRDGIWWHYRVSERAPQGERIGQCSTAPRFEVRASAPTIRRTHEECTRKLSELASHWSASQVLSEARRTFTEQSQPDEGDD